MSLSNVWSKLYLGVMRLSAHRHAERWLFAVSFAESSFFPIPPDLMLAPMTLARAERWWKLALLTTLGSVLGGIAGWLLGYYLIEAALPLIERAGYLALYHQAQDWFARYGMLAVFIAGFTPIPYKMFTLAAGASAMPMLPFVAASCVGRGARFFLVAGLIRVLGPRIEPQLRRWVDGLGWATLVAALVGILIWQLN